MAYQEHGMWKVLDVLRRVQRGESQKVVAAATGVGRKTIRQYLGLAKELGWEPGTDQEPDETLSVRILDRARPGRPRDPGSGESEKVLLPHLAQITEWLSRSGTERGLKLTKVHRLLERQGIKVPYSSLHRFAVNHCEFGKKQTTLLRAPCRPGELAEIDFGRLGYILDTVTGRKRLLWALIVVLVHSRHMYVHVSYSQTLSAVIDGLEAAWESFGGVAWRVVLDNLRASIKKADRYDPVFQKTFDEYAKHRGFIIDPAVAYHPTGKPIVERQVPYVRENFFRGEEWLNIGQVQREVVRWCRETAGTRVHGTTRRRPLAVFEDEERLVLLPIEGPRFDTPKWAECTVHPDHHVKFGKALYSAPTDYVGKLVTVRGDRSLVRIYYRGELIKTHPCRAEGGRSTDYDDYPKDLRAYARRDPDYMIREAKTLGKSIGRFTEKLLAGDFPWAKLRQAQKLLRLTKKYGRQRLEEACARALAFDLINVKRVENILLGALRELPTDSKGQILPLPLPNQFLRPSGSFTHSPTAERRETIDGDQAVTEDRSQETEALRSPRDPARSGGLCQEGEAQSRGLPGTDTSG